MGVVNTGRPLQVKYWGVATPAALTPVIIRYFAVYVDCIASRHVKRISRAALSVYALHHAGAPIPLLIDG